MARQKDGISEPREPVLNGPVDASNFARMAQASIRAQGGQGFVIRNEAPKDGGAPTPAEWHAWMVYFEDHGVPTRFMRVHGVATVPKQWPEDFDLTRETSDRWWKFPSERAHDPYMRQRVAALFKELARSVDPGLDPRSRRQRPQTRPEAIQAVADGFPHLRGPLTLSKRLAETFRKEIDRAPLENEGE
jgi:hypothetical protein